MKKINFLAILLYVILLNPINAQVISHFTWNDLNQDPEIADVGPNATSISPDATITADGANGTPGLNAGNERTNINMILPNDPIFNVPDIDISIDYQRDENSGTFMKRGSNFSFLGASNLFVRYQVMATIDSTITTVNSGNVYNIPRTNDNTFRKYRFTFDAATGIGRLTVDGVEMWASAPRPNSILVWDNSTIKIGDKMDGSSENKAIYDNLLIQRYQTEPLPIELISFSADESAFKNQVDLNWSTASEKNNDFFTLEKSTNGKDWELLKTLNGAGNSTHTLKYRWTDQSPYSGISYYRLKQTDFDGKFSYSSIESVNIDMQEEFTMFPNTIATGEALNFSNLNSKTNGEQKIVIYNTNGAVVKTIHISSNKNTITLENDLNTGYYIVKFNSMTKKLVVR